MDWVDSNFLRAKNNSEFEQKISVGSVDYRGAPVRICRGVVGLSFAWFEPRDLLQGIDALRNEGIENDEEGGG